MTHQITIDLQPYLAVSEYIDWQQQKVMDQAARLAGDGDSHQDIARACYLFVRDEIKHAGDWQLSPTTCQASEVLLAGHGWCYAKSHLLAALLRANSIPAGLCYQRLTIEGNVPPFCLHGLVAAYFEDFGWYRMDPRGNKPGVDADFCPPVERLAFPIINDGEADLPGIFPEPRKAVIDCLKKYHKYEDVVAHLPDIPSA